MCLYQSDAGNQKLFSFREARLLFSRILNTKGNEKNKREGLGLAIF